MVDLKSTYEEKGKTHVWIRQNSAGLEKRFCTLQLWFRPEEKQPKSTIIFRGLGLRISLIEKASWDTRVNVMFQQKAWADRKLTNEYALKFMVPWLEQEHPQEETIHFMDNLDAQVQPTFWKS